MDSRFTDMFTVQRDGNTNATWYERFFDKARPNMLG